MNIKQRKDAYVLENELFSYCQDSKPIIISPLSIKCGLEILKSMADGVTKDQLENVLLQADEQINISTYYKGHKHLKIASRLYVNKDIVQNVIFKNVKSLSTNPKNITHQITKINKWCKKRTKGMISQIINEIKSDTLAILLNVVHFKGEWLHEYFKVLLTKEKKFYTTKKTYKLVTTMRNKSANVKCIKNYTIHDREYNIVKLNFRNESQICFLLIQTNTKFKKYSWYDNDSCYQFESNKIFELINHLKPTNVYLQVPKFKIESSIPSEALETVLKNVQVDTIFYKPNFDNFIPNVDIAITDIIHKAVIDVNETGVEAAAVTAYCASRGGSPRHEKNTKFAFNFPFYFALINQARKHIIFYGIYK